MANDYVGTMADGLIETTTPYLDGNRKKLLRRVFIKHPDLMNIKLEWSFEIIENYLKTLSDLLVLVTNTTPTTMDSMTKKNIDLLLDQLEQYNVDFDYIFIHHVRNIVSKAWAYHLEACRLRKEAEDQLRTKMQTLDDKMQGEVSIYLI